MAVRNPLPIRAKWPRQAGRTALTIAACAFIGFIPTTSTAFEKDESLANADASWLGEAEYDHLGRRLCGAGDVDDDGYDDFLLGSPSNDQTADGAGKAYLVLGKEDGWLQDTAISDSDASFVGEGEGHGAGVVGPAGDVNGDGFDDFLVGATGSHYDLGGAYLVFGREDGWSADQPLSQTDASFAGEANGDDAGSSVNGLGDVNGDGLDDFAVGASGTWGPYKGRGTTYLILGKTTGWAHWRSLADADASFDPGFDSSSAG